MYIQIRPGRSWHIIATWTRVPGRAITLCGRTAAGESKDDFGEQKSCETCLRIMAKQALGAS